ncbi:MAG: DUF2490 domain-containing protein [Polaribacter sp.]
MKKVLLIFLFLPLFSSAQQSDLGNWLIYFGNKQFNEKWNLHHEIQYRNYNLIGDMEQLLIRTGIGYNIGSKSNLLVGYGYINSENYTGISNAQATVQEHRIYQQFITKQNIGTVALQHRYRFEQRFIEGDFRTRFRYFLGINIPFKESNYYTSFYNEIFLNGDGNVFDRNRIYSGIGYRFNSKVRFEFGYMSQVFQGFSRDQLNFMTFYNF